MNEILNENFVRKYRELKSHNRYWSFGIAWKLGKKDIVRQLKENVGETTDFIWYALSLSLVSKIIYNYAPQEQLYISDYFQWKIGETDTFDRFYPHQFFRMTDTIMGNLPDNLNSEVSKHSKTNIELYTDFFISIFMRFDSDLVGIETETILHRAVNDDYFIKEFSDERESLSKLYLSSLKNKIRK